MPAQACPGANEGPAESREPTAAAVAPSSEELAALDAIVGGRWAWVSQIFLVASGHDPAVLAGLVAAGMIAPWDTPVDPTCLTSRGAPPCGLVLTLTPYGAERLGVEIEETGPVERPRWSRIRYDERGRRTDKGKPAIKAFRYESRLRLPELVPDPAPGPEFLVDEESGEEIRLFVATEHGGTTKGIPILIDKRLRGKKK